MIDITITATMRSYILRQTVSSFKKYLFTDDLFKDKPPSVIINIDPVGPDRDVRFVLSVIRLYLSRIVFIRVPGEPSFPKAFKWVWSQTEADFVFHLEDEQIMFADFGLGRHIVKVSGHLKMNPEGIVIGKVDENIFTAASDGDDIFMTQFFTPSGRVVVFDFRRIDSDRLDCFIDYSLPQAADNRFYFGKFRHGGQSIIIF